MPCCVAPNCNNATGKKGHPYVRLFTFPKLDKKLLSKWEEMINIHDPRPYFWKAGPNSRICEEHFEKSDIWTAKTTSIKYLKNWAIPTIFNSSGRQ